MFRFFFLLMVMTTQFAGASFITDCKEPANVERAKALADETDEIVRRQQDLLEVGRTVPMDLVLAKIFRTEIDFCQSDNKSDYCAHQTENLTTLAKMRKAYYQDGRLPLESYLSVLQDKFNVEKFCARK